MSCSRARGLSVLLIGVCVPADAGPRIFRNGFEVLPANTVQDVQQLGVTGSVYLPDRVVTARSADGRNLWIADSLTAAAWQGVYVFRGGSATPLGAEFAIGARVDVLGDTAEFDLIAPGDTLTEIVNPQIGLFLAPQASPLPLTATPAQLAPIADGEPYEGVLVRITEARVISTTTGNRASVRDNNNQTIVLDDDAFNYGALVVGMCYASITGVMHVNTVDDERRLLPRGVSDFVSGNGCN